MKPRSDNEPDQEIFWTKNKITSKGRVLKDELVHIGLEKNYMLSRFKRCKDCIKEHGNISKITKKLIKINEAPQRLPLRIKNLDDIPGFKTYESTCIEGCPGSGKSTFASNIVEKAYKKYVTIYFSPTHDQLMNFARKLESKGLDFVIMSDESKLKTTLTKYHYSNLPDYNKKQKNRIPKDARIILSTVNKPLKDLSRSEIQLIIIDEATRVTFIEALAAIYEIKTARLFITTGDTHQLGSSDANGRPMINILQYLRENNFRTLLLNHQYRFGEAINKHPSKLFYKGSMITGSNIQSDIKLYEISSCEHEKNDIFGCQREADLCKNLAEFYNATIITPYTTQVRKIQMHENDDQVITVDKSQGGEFDNVILSIGRNSGRGFLSKKRLNVAITRAKLILIIVAHSDTINSISELYKIAIILDKEGKRIII